MSHRIGPAACMVAGILLALAAPVLGATWHVAVGGDDSGPGSPLEPFLTIARGIDVAATGDTVLVHAGTHDGPGNRDLDFAGKGLTVRSLSGDPATCIIDGQRDGSGTGWIFHAPADGDPVVIEGLTLTRGAVGAIFLCQGLELRHCIVDSTGTGVLLPGFAGGTFSDCQFLACGIGLTDQAPDGGMGQSIALVERCLFGDCGIGARLANDGKRFAGSAPRDKSPYGSTFRDCDFIGNTTGVQGGVEAAAVFEDCDFVDNAVGYTAWDAVSWFTGCEFVGNTTVALDAYLIAFGTASVTVTSCLFRDNPGDGLQLRGRSFLISDTQVLGTGGVGVRIRAGRIDVANCTIAGSGGVGLDIGNFYDDALSIVIASSTVAHNGTGLVIGAFPGAVVDVSHTIIAHNSGEGLADASGVAYTACVVYGNGADALADGWQAGVAGNFAKDPLFCDAPAGDCGLAANSPCLPSVLHAQIGAQGSSCDGIPAPVPLAVRDVPNDQGGRVRLIWFRSGYDEAGSAYPILGYDIYRRSDAKAAAQGRDPAGKLLGWDYLLRLPARGDQAYQAVAATLCDSTITDGLCLSVYMVSAVTADPLVFFDSAPDSGWSTDDLAPGAPVSVTAAYTSGAVALGWDNAPESDFRLHRIYRDSDPGFVPTPANRLAETAVSAWTDPTPNPWGYRYKITTVDFAGNESIPGEPAALSSVGSRAQASRTALRGAAPNPFNPTTTLSFELAAPGHARLRVYNAAGRLVATLVDEQRGAGRHEVDWNGRDDGGRAVASGVYLYRLESAAYGETRRMILLK